MAVNLLRSTAQRAEGPPGEKVSSQYAANSLLTMRYEQLIFYLTDNYIVTSYLCMLNLNLFIYGPFS